MYNRRETSLDLIRGCAALLVCANHLRAISIESHQNLSSNSALQILFYLMTSLGHQAVIVFFVLSGYFVGGSLLTKGTAFSWCDYGSARLTRLWVVLVPALFLTLMSDLLLQQVAPNVLSGAYAQLWSMGPQPGGDHTLSIEVLVGNLIFLQQIIIPVYGSNDPLWSLAYEFWYYVLFPLILIGLGDSLGSYRAGYRALALMGVGLILLMLPEAGRVGFLCWLGGVAVYVLKRGGMNAVRLPVWLGLITFIIGLGVSKWLGKAAYAPALVDLVMGVSTVLLLTAIAHRTQLSTLWLRVSHGAYHLSEMSYSLYLIHFPLVLILGGTVFRDSRLMPSLYGLAVYFCWLGFLLVFAWCFWHLFERRTPEIRRIVQRFQIRMQ